MSDLTTIDFAARALGILGSGAFFGLTLSTSTALIPIIQRNKSLSARQRLELWDDQFTLSVVRWTPTGIVGAFSLLYAAYRTPSTWTGPASTPYDSRRTLLTCGLSMLAMIPLTVAFIFPTVFKLKAKLEKVRKVDAKGGDGGVEPWEEEEEKLQVSDLLKKWDGRHWGRIACSFLCFSFSVYDLVRIASRG